MTAAPKPLRLSWSKLKTQEECRQKAFLVGEGKTNPAKNLRSYYHGMVVDRVMRNWLADPQPGTMPGMVDAAIQDGIDEARDTGDGVVRWKNAGDRAQVRDYCVELVTRLEPILREHVLSYDTFGCGIRFTETVTMPYLDGTPTKVTLVGEMDLIVQSGDQWAVWDLKGTADDQYWRRVVGQLTFYDLAVLARYRKRSLFVGLIQPMCKQPVLAWTVTEDQRRDLWSRLVRMAHDIWRSDFACKDTTSGCQWCEVRHACIRYRPDADPLGTLGTLGTLGAGLRLEAATQTQAKETQ